MNLVQLCTCPWQQIFGCRMLWSPIWVSHVICLMSEWILTSEVEERHTATTFACKLEAVARGGHWWENSCMYHRQYQKYCRWYLLTFLATYPLLCPHPRHQCHPWIEDGCYIWLTQQVSESCGSTLNTVAVRIHKYILPTHNLVLDVATRWNSVYKVSECIKEQETIMWAVLLSSKKARVQDLVLSTLTSTEISKMWLFDAVLKPFTHASAINCSSEKFLQNFISSRDGRYRNKAKMKEHKKTTLHL